MTSYTEGELVKKVLNGKLLGMIIHNQNTEVKYQMGNQIGLGTLTLPNGENYVGEWKDGKRNGQGTHLSPDGKKV